MRVLVVSEKSTLTEWGAAGAWHQKLSCSVSEMAQLLDRSRSGHVRNGGAEGARIGRRVGFADIAKHQQSDVVVLVCAGHDTGDAAQDRFRQNLSGDTGCG